MEKEVLRLFKSYLGKNDNSVNEKALKYGLLISNKADDNVINNAIKMYGKDGFMWNQTFHKDFETVRNTPMEDLIIQQIMHYITTYGFEELGIYNSETVYIPNEKLDIPELDVTQISLIPIHAITPEILTTKLMKLLTSGIALSEQSVKDIMVLSDYINKDYIDDIKNREVKVALYKKYNIMPHNPEEFLRYLLFSVTDNTLKIQNVKTYRDIKDCDKRLALKMLQSYLENTPNGLQELSSIFLRNKKLFLAFKIKVFEINSENKDIQKQINAIINKLRKQANKSHRPLSKNILDCLTDMNTKIDLNELEAALDNITAFREVRTLNGVLYRLQGNNDIVYKIRNGKSFVKTLPTKDAEYLEKLIGISKVIKNHLVNRISKQVKGKTIYIPQNVTYATPTSEKQFSGNIPNGSYLETVRNGSLIYGVHWNNLPNNKSLNREERVDLDLKQMNKSEIFGWDASYRSSSSDILFSGDMTDAPISKGGATELFYVGSNYGNGAFLITLNMYTRNTKDVPFEFMIAKAKKNLYNCRNYVVNPNNILEKVKMIIKKDEREKVVGFITIGDTVRFYFNDFSAGVSSRTSCQNEITMGAFDYLQSYSKIQLKLNDLLKEAGALVVDTPEIPTDGCISKPVDINLSPSVITKETIIEILGE